MEFLSGFESTHIVGTGLDVLTLTRHTDLYEHDLALARASGLRMLRYPAPWHSIEKQRGVFDWRWMDRAMAALQQFQLVPILDPLHHTSFPDWLVGGFAHPQFAEVYLEFVTALALRYPWVTHYTVVNEPFVTTWFCGHEGVWYPYHRGDEAFVTMLRNIGRTLCEVSHMLVARIPHVTLVHVDAAEKHRALDVPSQWHAWWCNERRFVVLDLILGRIEHTHVLYPYLTQHGMTADDLQWFQQHPARIDILGLDYYAHGELEWNTRGRVWPNQQPEGFAAVALDYVDRYHLPVMLSETNIRGYCTDRLSWLKFMYEQCELLRQHLTERDLSFHGFCWFPLIDSTDWDTLLCEANGRIDPQGIYWLDPHKAVRHPSELSDVFTALAQRTLTSNDIPAYHFQPPLQHTLQGLSPLMRHWQWRTPMEIAIPQQRQPLLQDAGPA